MLPMGFFLTQNDGSRKNIRSLQKGKLGKE
jgi:hypothetical protein